MSRFQLSGPLQKRLLAGGNAEWLDTLDARVDRLLGEWELEAGASLMGGSASLILDVTRADGSPAILKLNLPDAQDLGDEARVYRIARGRGYARLFAHDAGADAILVEKLGAPLATLDLSLEDQLDVLCATLADCWFPVTPVEMQPFMTGAGKADWLADWIERSWGELGGPCSQAARDLALDYCAERKAAFDPATSVLVHGDAHALNALLEPGADPADPRCRFVDPDGIFAERACDLAVPMRENNGDLLATDTVRAANTLCDGLARRTGVDRGAIWQWGFMERVSTGLLCTQLGIDEAADYLLVADRLAAATA